VSLSIEGRPELRILGRSAETLAGVARRMYENRGAGDARIEGVTLRRGATGPAEVAIGEGPDGTASAVSDLDLAALADMLAAAATERGFSGSIGLLCAPREAIAEAASVPDAPEPFAPLAASSPMPRARTGGSPAGIDVVGRRRRHDGLRDGSAWGTATFPWQPPHRDRLAVVDGLSAELYRAVRAFWRSFDEGAWEAAEWTRTYAGRDVWRMVDRGNHVSGRVVVAPAAMGVLEEHGLVAADDLGLRVPTQACYDLWRSAMLAGVSWRDEALAETVRVPVGFRTEGMDAIGQMETCVVEFDDGEATVHPLEVTRLSWGEAFRADLRSIRIDDYGSAEIATRVGDYLYPESDALYAANLRNRAGRDAGAMGCRYVDPGDRAGWHPGFVGLIGLHRDAQHALDRYRTAIRSRALPMEMPSHERPANWWDDQQLRNGLEIKRKREMPRAGR
jgi:hypothetical protein